MRLGAGLVLGWILVAHLGADPWQGFTALTVSPDGKSLATGGSQGEVLWLEASTGEVRGRWLVPEGPVVAVAFVQGRLGVATLGARYAIDLLDAQASPLVPGAPTRALGAALDQLQGRWTSAPPLLRGSTLTHGATEVRGTADGVITVTGPQPASWKAHDAAITGLVILPGTSRLVSASFDGTLALWDLDGTLRGRL